MADLFDIGEEEMTSLYKALVVLQNMYLDMDDNRQNMDDSMKVFANRLFDSTQLIKEILNYG